MTKKSSKTKAIEEDGNASSSDTNSQQDNITAATFNDDDDEMSREDLVLSSAQTTEKEAGDKNNATSVVAVENLSPDKKKLNEGDSTTATATDKSKQSTKSSRSDAIDKEDNGKGESEDCSIAAAKVDTDHTTSTTESSKSDSKVPSSSNDNKNKHQSTKNPNTNSTTERTTSSTKQQQHNQPNNKPPIEQDFDSDQYSDKNDTLLTMSFNQDGGCLAIGTASGFRICNVHPYQETFRRNLGFQQPSSSSSSSPNGVGGGGGSNGSGGIARIEMLYRTNLLALTGHHSTASHSQYPPNKVLIYDDHSQRTIGELSFRQKILVTKLRRDRIVVVLRDRVYVYNFSDLSLLDKVHTGDNPAGLIGLSLDNWGVGGGGGSGGGGDVLGGNTNNNNVGARNGMVLACPSTQRGQVRVELYGLRRTTFVDAHESALGALALSVDGSLLATASERGTVIRLYDTRGVTVGGGRVLSSSSASSSLSANNGSGSTTTSVSSSVPLKEFRRGVERATISCLTFSLDSCWLGCASDHGTVHIFQAQDPNNSTNNYSSTTNSSSSNNNRSNKPRSSSMTGKAMRMLPKLVSSPKKFLMDGEHSYAQVRGVPHPHACAFVPDRERTIAVAGTDDYDNGVLLLAEFGGRRESFSTTNTTTTTTTGATSTSNNSRGGSSSAGSIDDTEAKRLGYHRFFKKGGSASMHGRNRRGGGGGGGGTTAKSSSSSSSKDGNENNIVEEGGGAYIDDTSSVNLRMNHIRIGDENEDDFVPIDYDMEKVK